MAFDTNRTRKIPIEYISTNNLCAFQIVHEFIRCVFISADMADTMKKHLDLEIVLHLQLNPLTACLPLNTLPACSLLRTPMVQTKSLSKWANGMEDHQNLKGEIFPCMKSLINFVNDLCWFIFRVGLSKPVGPKVNVQPTYMYSMAKPSDQVKIAKEIEKKAAEFGKTSTDDSAPFNFQVF